jgi:mRNA interferase YafQ
VKLSRSKQFKKDLRKYATEMGDKHFQSLIEALTCLVEARSLPLHFRDHTLKGRLAGYRELHIGGDLLLLYTIEGDVVYLLRLGSHAEILGMQEAPERRKYHVPTSQGRRHWRGCYYSTN